MVHFSIAVFPGSPAERERRQRLFAALLASLLLHLLASLLFPPAVARAPSGVRGSAAVLVTLRGEVQPSAPAASRAALPLLAPAGEPPAAARKREGSEELLAELGQGRLAAQVPSYLMEPLYVPQDVWYFARAELTVPPLLQDEPLLQPLEDPGGATAGTGKVVLRVFVAADGAVERVEVASSSLPPAFAEAAVAAFARVRFRPGEIEGVAVTSQTYFELVFDGGEAGRSHATDQLGLR